MEDYEYPADKIAGNPGPAFAQAGLMRTEGCGDRCRVPPCGFVKLTCLANGQ